MHKVSHELGLPIGFKAKLGLIVLQSDETIEYEFWELISGLNLAPVSYTHLRAHET